MRDPGWERKRLRVDGDLQYCYIKGDEPYKTWVVSAIHCEKPRIAPIEDEDKFAKF